MNSETPIQPAIHHVNMLTTRPDEMIEWYCMVLGAEVNFRNEMAAFLTTDGANHRVAIGSLPGISDDPDKDQHARVHHSAFEYEDADGLLGTYERLKGEGILPVMCIDHGLTMSFYYSDPDGNQVELQYDNFGSWEESTDYIRNSQDFKDNPIGVFLDPDKLLEARTMGADRWELHERTFAGEFAAPAVELTD